MTQEITQKPLEILVVDDDLDIRQLFETIIKGEGENVTTGIDGIDAVEKYVARYEGGMPYDAVITDLAMPRADGVVVVERVKNLHPNTQVIVITGYEPNEEYRILSDRLGQLKPDGAVKKPMPLDGLIHIIGQIKAVIERRKTEPDYQPDPGLLP